MKLSKLRTLFSTVFLLYVFLGAIGYSKADPTYPFKVGEHLQYDVRFGRIQVFVLDFTLLEKVKIDGLDAYHILAELKGSNWYRITFRYSVQDTFHTYVDAKTLLPIKAESFIREGNASLHMIVNFDQKNGRAVMVLKQPGKPATERRLRLSPDTYDWISLAYYVRTQELKDRVKVNVFDGISKSMTFEVPVRPAETIDVRGMGKYKAKSVTQKVGRWFDLTSWISEDSNRLVVKTALDAFRLGRLKVNLIAWLREANI
jgi:hypothetical protein